MGAELGRQLALRLSAAREVWPNPQIKLAPSASPSSKQTGLRSASASFCCCRPICSFAGGRDSSGEIAARDTPRTSRRRQSISAIGINLGDIIIDENDIFGDGVTSRRALKPGSETGRLCLALGLVRRSVFADQPRHPVQGQWSKPQVKNIPPGAGVRLIAAPSSQQTGWSAF